MHVHSRFLIVLFMWMLALPALAQSLSANVDRTEVGINETVTLRVRFEGSSVSGSPNFSSLEGQFDILTNQKSTQHSIINGDVSASTEWTMVLAPRSTGQVLIPPFSLSGATSSPIKIRVVESANTPSSAQNQSPVFLETEVDKSEVFVQEQFIVTYRLFYNRNVDNLEKPDLDLENARVQELPRVEYQRTLGHTSYGVAEFKFAVFPDASGKVEIPEAIWTVRTNDVPNAGRFGFSGGRYQVYRPRTEDVTVDVKPKAASYPKDKQWLPSSDVTISESWSTSPDEFERGQPITRTIRVEAEGVRSEQLPPITQSGEVADFKFYPDQPHQDNEVTASGVRAIRSETTAIVPTRSGELTLPEVSVTWWDTDEQAVKVARIPARALQVSGAAPANEPPPVVPAETPQAPVTDTAAPDPGPPLGWLAFTLVAVLAAAVFAWLWWQQRQKPATAQTPADAASLPKQRQKAWQRVASLCRSEQLPELRLAILQWGRLNWPNEPGLTLDDIAQHSGNARLAQEFKKLDKNLYGAGGESVDTAAIESTLKTLTQRTTPKRPDADLKPLYHNR